MALMLWHGLPTVPLVRPKVSRRSGETCGPTIVRGRETRAQQGVPLRLILFSCILIDHR
jgi:hypothetical protein